MILPDSSYGEVPCADDETVEGLVQRIGDHDLLVSVGSGTVNDVVKMAAHQKNLPFYSVPTAASMNGYTSAIAAILSDGVKRTLPTGQVTAVFGDLEVLSKAPVVMNVAGFGDLLSKPYSNACWYLGATLAGAHYSEVPAELLDGPFTELLPYAAGVGTGNPEAMKKLMEVLLLSGCAMALAGSSSPASGGEHLLSHYWDMVAHCNGRATPSFHGTQVGIATLLTGRLYEGILHPSVRFAGVGERLEAYPADREEWVERVRTRHPNLTPDVLDEVIEESLLKYLPIPEQRDRLLQIKERWSEISAHLQGILMPVDAVEKALKEAGGATRGAAIGLQPAQVQEAICVARDIRSRYTILDFAADLGILESYSEMAIAGDLTP